MMADAFPGKPPATLVRQYEGRLLDISSVGCLIETGASLQPGTVGTLEAVIDGQSHREAVRVARLVPARDATTLNQVGLEFLLVAPPGAQSIRAAITRLAAGAESLVTFVH